MKVRSFAVLGVILLLSTMGFAGTCAAPTVVPADGRTVDFDFIAAGTTNVYQVNVTKGHSYSLEVRQDYDPVNTDLSPATINQGSCAGATEVTTDTHLVDPAVPANTTRFSFIAAATGTDFIQVVHTVPAGTGRYISVSLADTTMFGGSYYTGPGYLASYSFTNTTGATITGTLTLVDAVGGGVDGTSTITIPAFSSALVDTNGSNTNATKMTIAASKLGGAFFVYNGPPGAVLIDAFLQNFTLGATPFTQTFQFKPVRQGR